MCAQGDSKRLSHVQGLRAVASQLRGYNDLQAGFEELQGMVAQDQERSKILSYVYVRGMSRSRKVPRDWSLPLPDPTIAQPVVLLREYADLFSETLSETETQGGAPSW